MSDPLSSRAPLRESFHHGVRERDAFINRLHDGEPLVRDANGFWIATRFDVVREVLGDYKRFTSKMTVAGAAMALINDDPPRHTTLRRLVREAFTQSRFEAMRPDVEAIAGRLVAAIEPDREVDVIDALAVRLPLAVMARFLGVPERDQPQFLNWAPSLAGLLDVPLGEDPRTLALMLKARATMTQLQAYFERVAAARLRQPAQDVLTLLAHAEDSGVALSPREAASMAVLFVVAGNVTTTTLIGNLLNRLAAAPLEWQRLRTEAALLDGAIEETLRVDGPGQFINRIVSEDTMLAGCRLRKGELIVVYLAAANRDPSVWPDAATFDPERPRLRNLTFGHGVHACLGAPLSWLETQILVQTLLQRFDRIAHGGTPAVPLPSGMMYGFSSLPLVFSSPRA